MPVDKTNKFSCNSTGVASSSSVSRLESKDINSKKRILLNTKSKITSKDVKKSKSSFTSVANKNDTMNSNGKKALFTSPVAAKSSKLGDTPVVVKSTFSVATAPKETNKMKPKADIGIIVGYSESSRGFGIYNRRTRKIIKTIHVKFDELTTMAFECNNSGPEVNCSNFQDSSEDVNAIQTQQDLDNLFGPLYEEYYTPRTPEVSDNSAAKTLDNEDTPSSSSIIVEDNDAPHIVTSSEEPVRNYCKQT
ncbi:hypothetical protein Tco_0024882 [Tanacetum coccineum]